MSRRTEEHVRLLLAQSRGMSIDDQAKHAAKSIDDMRLMSWMSGMAFGILLAMVAAFLIFITRAAS